VYAEDVDLSDVQAIERFLSARIARLASAERGSDERQAARSIKAALLFLVGSLQHVVPLIGEASGELETQTVIRREVRTCWNALCALVAPWQWHEDFDQERWRLARYWDAGHEAEIVALLDRVVPREL
jgi:hypothetical protein